VEKIGDVRRNQIEQKLARLPGEMEIVARGKLVYEVFRGLCAEGFDGDPEEVVKLVGHVETAQYHIDTGGATQHKAIPAQKILLPHPQGSEPLEEFPGGIAPVLSLEVFNELRELINNDS
jgi:hypothetical protein